MSNDPNTFPIILTKLLLMKEINHTKFKVASKESQKANRRAKNSFFNVINSSMLNLKFQLGFKDLMKKSYFQI